MSFLKKWHRVFHVKSSPLIVKNFCLRSFLSISTFSVQRWTWAARPTTTDATLCTRPSPSPSSCPTPSCPWPHKSRSRSTSTSTRATSMCRYSTTYLVLCLIFVSAHQLMIQFQLSSRVSSLGFSCNAGYFLRFHRKVKVECWFYLAVCLTETYCSRYLPSYSI